jgi:hypothetical protein
MDIHGYPILYITVSIYRNIVVYEMAMKKIMLALPDELLKILEKERKERYLQTIPETIRVILGEHFRKG